MKKALESFVVGAGAVLLVGALGIGVGWTMIVVLEFFRPMLGVFGALVAFYALAALSVGIGSFLLTLFNQQQAE